MNIGILSDKYPPHNAGGAGVIAANLAEKYSARGHNITVVTAVEDATDAGERRQNGVTLLAFQVTTVGPLRPYYSIYNPSAVPKVAAIFDQYDFDLVHAHNLHQYLSFHCISLAKRREIPVVLTAHDAMSVAYGKLVPKNEYVTRTPKLGGSENGGNYIEIPTEAYELSQWEQLKRRKIFHFPLRNRLNQRYLNDRVDRTVSVSNALRRGLATNDVYTDRVIHNGIDTDRYDDIDEEAFRTATETEDKRIILFSSRPEYYKGGEHLAKAFKQVADTHDDVVLVVTGSENEFFDRMRACAQPHGERVISTGWVEEPVLRSGYTAAEFVVTPSLYLDPFPTVNLEALASRTPVVATCFGGSRELVTNRETGLLTDPRDIDGLATAMDTLLDSPEKRRRYGRNGRRRVEESFTLDEQCNKYLSLFAEILRED